MLLRSFAAAVAVSLLGLPVAAQQADLVPTGEDVRSSIKEPSYSPYAGRSYPTIPLWGDTHLHTSLSLDARALGATLGPEEAYRLARGEEVTSATGLRVKLSRPLDWLVVADHSDAMGAMNEIVAGNPKLLQDPQVRKWHQMILEGGESAYEATMDVIATFSQGKTPEVLKDKEFIGSVWESYLKTAEEFNAPGTFTAMIGYEWTSTEGGNNLHRNVLYRDDRSVARRLLPYTAAESFNPEDLWKWMARYEAETGGQVLAIAHNGNLSNGLMFPEINPATGEPLTRGYAEARNLWEPLYEVTQMKGDGETHPLLSPNDELADYGTWDKGNLGPIPKEDWMLQYEYAREALKNGLRWEAKLGTNPYQFGMVGSTDSHTSLSTAEEENFFGKAVHKEPSPHRMEKPVYQFGEITVMGWEQMAAGYAGVWATENTREAIWDAMKRREVYATTGSRILVRFWGGWDFEVADANSRLPAEAGYTKGVPMGGELQEAPVGKAPTFLAAALKDHLGGNLDRIQIVKGWLDSAGRTHEKVYDVVWGDAEKRKPGRDGQLPPVGNTVDVKSATWTNTIGDPELITVWEDPDFDPARPAFYYARVIEIPTPRWTAYDAKRYGITMDDEVPMTIQERAYTSPIWYQP
ncbi:MAG: hypothetical protein AMS21_03760 [Gemmatimonas sp. SG8_38_2]|nr:MAG: hypothetical protein AMS21_03760 [Gemmatimonas sp. SG8_38_2]